MEQGKAKRDLSTVPGTGHIPTLKACPCFRNRLYTDNISRMAPVPDRNRTSELWLRALASSTDNVTVQECHEGMTAVQPIPCRMQYVVSCESVQYRFLKKCCEEVLNNRFNLEASQSRWRLVP